MFFLLTFFVFTGRFLQKKSNKAQSVHKIKKYKTHVSHIQVPTNYFALLTRFLQQN